MNVINRYNQTLLSSHTPPAEYKKKCAAKVTSHTTSSSWETYFNVRF